MCSRSHPVGWRSRANPNPLARLRQHPSARLRQTAGWLPAGRDATFTLRAGSASRFAFRASRFAEQR